MNNPNIDLIFPTRSLLSLRDLRGTSWQKLVDRVTSSKPDSLDLFAFVLLMARLNNCATCNADSYRAMTGCTNCSIQALKRYHESDEKLLLAYQTARVEIDKFIMKKVSYNIVDPLTHHKEFTGEYVE